MSETKTNRNNEVAMKYRNVSLDSFSDSIKVRITGTAVVYGSLVQAMRILKASGYTSVTIAGDTYNLDRQACCQ